MRLIRTAVMDFIRSKYKHDSGQLRFRSTAKPVRALIDKFRIVAAEFYLHDLWSGWRARGMSKVKLRWKPHLLKGIGIRCRLGFGDYLAFRMRVIIAKLVLFCARRRAQPIPSSHAVDYTLSPYRGAATPRQDFPAPLGVPAPSPSIMAEVKPNCGSADAKSGESWVNFRDDQKAGSAFGIAGPASDMSGHVHQRPSGVVGYGLRITEEDYAKWTVLKTIDCTKPR